MIRLTELRLPLEHTAEEAAVTLLRQAVSAVIDGIEDTLALVRSRVSLVQRAA